MIYNVLILDTETTGLHPEKGAELIEVAAILYNPAHQVVIQTLATFFPCKVNPVETINGISPAWTNLSTGGWFIPALKAMADDADLIIAHNAQFDKTFLELIIPKTDSFWKKPWMCTKNNFKWPVTLDRNRLQDVCIALGVPYVNAHRALTDCHFIASCFNKLNPQDLLTRLGGFKHG